MTDEAKALAERLRAKYTVTDEFSTIRRPVNPDGHEAADLIETQAREIERLRDALGEICADSNPDWTEKRVYPDCVLNDIHTIAVNAYYKVNL